MKPEIFATKTLLLLRVAYIDLIQIILAPFIDFSRQMLLLSAYELPAGMPWRMCSWSAKFDVRAGRWTEIQLVILVDANGRAELAGSEKQRRGFGKKPSCQAGPVLANEKTSAS